MAIRRLGQDTTDVAYTLFGLAGAKRELGDLAEARRNIDEALALLRAHPSPKPTHLARTLTEHVEVDLAEGHVRCTEADEAVALMEKNAASDDPQRLYTEAVAAGCAWRLADTAETRSRAARTQEGMRKEFPADASRLKQANRYAMTQ